jgi:hypothetical protein
MCAQGRSLLPCWLISIICFFICFLHIISFLCYQSALFQSTYPSILLLASHPSYPHPVTSHTTMKLDTSIILATLAATVITAPAPFVNYAERRVVRLLPPKLQTKQLKLTSHRQQQTPTDFPHTFLQPCAKSSTTRPDKSVNSTNCWVA